jgi:hypothetical protein
MTTLNALFADKVIKNITAYTNDKDLGCLEIQTEDGSILVLTAFVSYNGDDAEGTELNIRTTTVVEHAFSS